MATGREVEIRGTRLHVEDGGGGEPPVVLSPGLMVTTRVWDAQVAALGGRYRCIAYDHRGQGRSGGATGRSISIDACAEDAAALIEALGVAPCHFVGLSMGGFVGMRLALRRPELVRSLALLDTSADPEPNVAKYRLLNAVVRWIGAWPVVDRVMPIFFGPTFLADPVRAGEVAGWRARLRGTDRGIWRAVNGVIEREGIAAELGRIDRPTLVVVGEEDVATVPQKAERLARDIPGAALVRIAGAGHTSPVEQPEQVNAALLRFLDGVEARRGAG